MGEGRRRSGESSGVRRRDLMKRDFGREPGDLRPITIHPNYLDHAEGSVLIECGLTRVLVAVSIEDRVPPFMKGRGVGWVTAEYSMLPRATHTRSTRDSVAGKIGGRTHEIQRLIGRSLRAIMDMRVLGERTLTVDCDVIQADGGTRTASITGAYVALWLAGSKARELYRLSANPVKGRVAAVSAGYVGGELLLDLAYEEDSKAEVDFTVVMTGEGDLVEVQGTAEGKPFSRAQMNDMLDLTGKGISRLFEIQQQAIQAAGR
jgi:ribonuclease PH